MAFRRVSSWVVFAFLGVCACKSRDAQVQSTADEGVLGSQPPALLPPASIVAENLVTRIAFGSCSDQKRPQPIWSKILLAKPDVYLAMGDNVYASWPTEKPIPAAYRMQALIPEFAHFRSLVPIFATWDDNDYGLSDGGADNPEKEVARQAFLDFFHLSKEAIGSQGEGIYYSKFLGPRGRRIQLIFLDTRWFRSPLLPDPNNRNRYLPDLSKDKTMLGDMQWQWLEKQFSSPADFRIVISSTQFLATDATFERWGNFPLERERLISLLEKNSKGVPTIVLSGDRHHGEISELKLKSGRKIIEITSSALNRASRFQVPDQNRLRVGQAILGWNFGMMEFDWRQGFVRAGLLDENGKWFESVRIALKK